MRDEGRGATREGRADATIPDPSLLHLLAPKWLTAKARASSGERGRGLRLLVLGAFGLAFWTVIFAVLFRLLRYFRGVPEIGVLLAGKLLGLMLVGFFSILLLSNVITALSSFFLARDLDLLVGAPVDWLKLYGVKLLETAITLLLVTAFPARRTRDILSVIAVLAAGGIVILFRLIRPERLARPEGFRSLVEFVTLLRTPTSPLLPSEWAQRGLMSWLEGTADLLPFYLLWSTAFAAIVLGALLHRALYARGFSKAQESAQSSA